MQKWGCTPFVHPRVSFRSQNLYEEGTLEHPSTMGKWLEIAQKMAQAARAGLAIERKRLNEILAERQRKQVSSSSQSSG